jgi:hypothetical protein
MIRMKSMAEQETRKRIQEFKIRKGGTIRLRQIRENNTENGIKCVTNEGRINDLKDTRQGTEYKN